jgi:serine/threonine protein phosphatase 1
MENVFVIGDIHGRLDMLEALLFHWNPEKEQLIVLGDAIDRGSNPAGVLNRLRQEGALLLRGNHEQMLLDWLANPNQKETSFYFKNGGKATIASLLGLFESQIRILDGPKLAKQIQDEQVDLLSYLHERPLYYEWGPYLFVHAGVQPFLKDWRNSNETIFLSIRELFYKFPNETGKIIVFGHTPTGYIRQDNQSDIWVSEDKSKIGIDGGAVYGHQLHGLSMHLDGTWNAYHINAKDVTPVN